MTIFQAIILGIIQGITEFLPISSSGHLIFLPKLFGWVDQGLAFDAVVHVGSLFAVIIYFRHKIFAVIRDFFKKGQDSKPNRRLGWLLIFTIIPAGIVGFFGSEIIENTLRSIKVIAFGLIFWGIILYAADRYALKHKNIKTLKQTKWKDALFIGMAQAIALIPGTSRSGITMTAGLFSKYNKTAAAEFSFLMSVPIIALAGLMKILGLISGGMGDLQFSVLVVGFVSAALSGFLAIWGLMKIIQKWSFAPFAIYRIVVGILILLFLV